MHTEEQRLLALQAYERCGCRVTRTIRKLGCPSRQALYRWIDGDRAAAHRTNGRLYSHYPAEAKRDALLMLDSVISPKEITEQLGLANVAAACNWTRKPRRKAKTVSKKRKADETVRAWDGFEGTEEERIRQLELEYDVLREVVGALRAESLDALTNREKAILTGHPRQKTPHPLRELTGFLRISKSSYGYQRKALARKDKYTEARRRIVEEFESAGRARSHRYITWKPRSPEAPIVLSEKVVKRLMPKKACSPDNAAMEGFFGRLENEFFYHGDWADVAMAELVSRLDSYLRFYNEGRPEEALGLLSPSRYREALRLAA